MKVNKKLTFAQLLKIRKDGKFTQSNSTWKVSPILQTGINKVHEIYCNRLLQLEEYKQDILSYILLSKYCEDVSISILKGLGLFILSIITTIHVIFGLRVKTEWTCKYSPNFFGWRWRNTVYRFLDGTYDIISFSIQKILLQLSNVFKSFFDVFEQWKNLNIEIQSYHVNYQDTLFNGYFSIFLSMILGYFLEMIIIILMLTIGNGIRLLTIILYTILIFISPLLSGIKAIILYFVDICYLDIDENGRRDNSDDFYLVLCVLGCFFGSIIVIVLSIIMVILLSIKTIIFSIYLNCARKINNIYDTVMFFGVVKPFIYQPIDENYFFRKNLLY